HVFAERVQGLPRVDEDRRAEVLGGGGDGRGPVLDALETQGGVAVDDGVGERLLHGQGPYRGGVQEHGLLGALERGRHDVVLSWAGRRWGSGWWWWASRATRSGLSSGVPV